MAFRVFDPVPAIVWSACGGLIAVGLTVSLVGGYPTPAKVTFAAALAGVAVSAWRYFQGRAIKHAKIVATTRSGTDILLDDETTRLRWNFGVRAVAERAIEDALVWWCDEFPHKAERLRSAWGNVIVRIRSELIVVGGKPVRGLSPDTGELLVAWLPGEPFDVAANLIRHETGHFALKILLGRYWVSGDDDHEYFQEHGYGA